ncbi:MAG: hypothetical protein KAR06_01385 [Deltaproteobacteria bacterium]|nr:hypothetical protein [Deltaproteobacteria bacterium]
MDFDGVRFKNRNGGYTNNLPCRIGHFEERRKYREAAAEIRARFEEDLREAVNTRVKRELSDEQWKPFFNKAWEDGHSNGYNEVIIYADDLCDVIRPFVKELNLLICG